MEPILPIISVYHHFFVLNGHQVVFHYTINDPAERSQSVAAIPSRLISHYLYKVLTFSLMRYLNQIFEVEICMCIFSFSLLLISFSLRGCDMI